MNEAIQAVEIPFVVNSITVISVLTCYALLHSMWDLKAQQMNIQQSLIWDLILYKFELNHNAIEETKKIYCTKDKHAVDHRRINK